MAVYQVYLKHHNVNGSQRNTEELLYEVPTTVDNQRVLIDPKVKGEMGKAGSFEFAMYVDHPYYNCWNQMKTMVRVVYFGFTIFYGRVLTIDIDHITSKKTVHCEGYLAFLLDTVIKGVADDDRDSISGATYVDRLISWHNSQCPADVIPYKQFVKGEVPGNYNPQVPDAQRVWTESSRKYGSTGWQDTTSAFSDLTKNYGGFLHARYENGTVYLDWVDNYYNDTVGDRKIEITNNAISMDSSTEVDSIFPL